MTTEQVMRYERRRRALEREIRAQQAMKEAVLGFLAILLVLAAFAVAGTMDAYDRQAELSYWESQGVTVSEGW